MSRSLNFFAVLLSLAILSLHPPSGKACKTLASSVSPGWTQGDATQCLYNAITSTACDTVVVDLQSDAWEVNPLEFNSVAALNNKVIIFEPGVVVKARAGFGTKDALFAFSDCDEFKMIAYGSVFSMRNADYTTGE